MKNRSDETRNSNVKHRCVRSARSHSTYTINQSQQRCLSKNCDCVSLVPLLRTRRFRMITLSGRVERYSCLLRWIYEGSKGIAISWQSSSSVCCSVLAVCDSAQLHLQAVRLDVKRVLSLAKPTGFPTIFAGDVQWCDLIPSVHLKSVLFHGNSFFFFFFFSKRYPRWIRRTFVGS